MRSIGQDWRAAASLGVPGRFGYPPRMRDVPDETLMKRYGQGDIGAFEALYERYRGPVYRYFLRQSPDEATAGDLYQGCWEKVIKARGRYRDKAPFRAWLFRVARNHLIDHHRGRAPETPLAFEPAAPDRDNPGAELEKGQRDRRLIDALATLPPEQRDAILLKLEGGLSLEEIARATGVGSETAKSRLRYATRKLKEVLQS